MKMPKRPFGFSRTIVHIAFFSLLILATAGLTMPAVQAKSLAATLTPMPTSTKVATPKSAATPKATTPIPAATPTAKAATPAANVTATPKPTATPKKAVTPTAVPTPKVTIPKGWTAVKDTRLGYSLAVPASWSELDLRGTQVSSMAGMIGQGKALEQLQGFLATKEGQMVGKVAWEFNVLSLMQGKIPPLLNVSVVPLPKGADATYVKGLVDANLGLVDQFAKVTKVVVKPTVVNQLQAVQGSANADLSAVGVADKLTIQVVGLIANDKLYLLTMVTRTDVAATVTPIFDQITASFRPE